MIQIDHIMVVFSRREWKKIIYYYKKVVRPDGIPNRNLDDFHRYDRRGTAYSRTFRVAEARVLLDTLISSSTLPNRRRDFLRSLRKQL